jgi:hypothetical protein
VPYGRAGTTRVRSRIASDGCMRRSGLGRRAKLGDPCTAAGGLCGFVPLRRRRPQESSRRRRRCCPPTASIALPPARLKADTFRRYHGPQRSLSPAGPSCDGSWMPTVGSGRLGLQRSEQPAPDSPNLDLRLKAAFPPSSPSRRATRRRRDTNSKRYVLPSLMCPRSATDGCDHLSGPRPRVRRFVNLELRRNQRVTLGLTSQQFSIWPAPCSSTFGRVVHATWKAAPPPGNPEREVASVPQAALVVQPDLFRALTRPS